MSDTGIFRSAAASLPNSPIVIPVRTGIGCGAVNDARSGSISGPSTTRPVDRIRPVEDDDRDLLLRGLLHDVDKRREVRVVASADVLDVEDESVMSCSMAGGRPPGVP